MVFDSEQTTKLSIKGLLKDQINYPFWGGWASWIDLKPSVGAGRGESIYYESRRKMTWKPARRFRSTFVQKPVDLTSVTGSTGKSRRVAAQLERALA